MKAKKSDSRGVFHQARALFCSFFFLPVLLGAQPFSCDGAFFLTTVSSSGSKLHRIDRSPSGSFQTREISLSEPERRLTCLGLSVQNLYLYALDFDTYELLRIDREGKIERLGIPENLNTQQFDFYGGEIGPGGNTLTVIARDKATKSDKAIYNISLTGPPYQANSIPIIADIDIALTDLATDPTSGIRYGFDQNSKRIIVLNGGRVSTYQHQNLSIVVTSLFFDQEGRLFGYGDADGGNKYTQLFAFDKSTGKAEKVIQGPSGSETDGCSCSYTVRFTRTVTPSIVLPCSEIEIEYRIVNYSGIGRLSTILEDELPSPFTITSVEPGSTSIFVMRSGLGSSKLRMENFEVIIRNNVLKVRAKVGDSPPATYLSQAFITNWPKGLGELISDNPATAQSGDPNRIVIGDPKKLEVKPEIFYNCEGDSIFVRLPIQADQYRWSNGSSNPVLAVDQPGRYWVEAGNNCWQVSDTFVVEPPNRLTVRLGESRRVKVNEKIDLLYTSNTGSDLEHRWQVSDGGMLSCTTCARPVLQAKSDAVVMLTVTNAEGCTASDSLSIGVDQVRNIFRPNAFSPDNDGINDRFFLQGRDGVVRYLRVFNRWGSLVFESRDGLVDDSQHGWDGTIDGSPAKSGVYLFLALVEFSDGATETFAGEITLLRSR